MSTNRSILDLQRGQRTRIPTLWLIIPAVMLVLVVMILLHTRDRDSISPIEILLGTQPAPAREDIVVSQDGVTVYMPANATELDGTLSISVAAPGLWLVADDSEWTLLKVVRIEFHSPNGVTLSNITFAAPLRICFHLTEEQWQAYTSAPESYRVQQYSEQTSPPGWKVLPLLSYADQFQLCGQATRLSLFGLAVHTPPVIPVTGGMPPVQTRDEDEHVSPLRVNPTDPPAAQVPPTQPPVIQPQPTNRPPAEPVVEPPAPNPGQGNGGGGNGNGNEGPGNGNGNGGGGNGNGNEGPGNGNGNGGGGNGNEGGGNGGEGNGNQGGGNGGEGNGNQGGGNGGEGNGNQGGGNGGRGNGNNGGKGKGP